MPTLFLLGNLVLASVIAGFVWAHQIEIFRAWRLLDKESFRAVHDAHWRTLPVWIVPIVLSTAGSLALIFYHPTGSPVWAIGAGIACQALVQTGGGLYPGWSASGAGGDHCRGWLILEVRSNLVVAPSDDPAFLARLYREAPLVAVLAEGGCGFGPTSRLDREPI